MSERKSWDVEPRRKPAQASPARPAPAAAPRARVPVHDMRPVARPRPAQTAPARAAAQPAPRRMRRPRIPTPAPRPGERLRERRRRARRTGRVIALCLLVVLIAAAWYAVWLPQLRVQTVEASGPHADALKAAAEGDLSGTYAHVLPRNSIFLFPKAQLRSALLSAYPDVEALSIARTSFNSISLTATPRVTAFLWCGLSKDAPRDDGCYAADAEGLIFASAQADIGVAEAMPNDAATSTASTTVEKQAGVAIPAGLRVYAPIDTDVPGDVSPIGAHLKRASSLPDALRFVQAIGQLGVPVTTLQIRDDEADLFTPKGTRVTYVLGREQEAATLAASALPTLNMTDGSIDYVDLRFSGKAYVRKRGE